MPGPGIDYAGPLSNVNRNVETGIRYGVIGQNEVLQAWADSSEADYPEMECSNCGFCGLSVDMASCPECETNLQNDMDIDINPIGFILDDGEYKAACGDDGDIFVMKSPFFTLCAFCSPCAPGAGYLMSPTPEGIRAYCFGHDWFDEGRAPYPVFRVDTGERVFGEGDVKGWGEIDHIRAQEG